ncbi:unnamed protein product [Symbiodinium natans]|uniref:Uncharacterized protein n=1 Tax=Symbiodinium natans TaxID=878477 RepID=A0A812T7X2_9DINO|nr:unnamed protein product [Symbiodinium natans]
MRTLLLLQATGVLSFVVPWQITRAVSSLLGPEALAAYALGQLTGNLTGRSIVNGLLLAYDTLGAQAFGRGEFREVGVLMLRAVLLAAVLLTPVAVAWSWAEKCFLMLGQEPFVASYAARYLQIFRFSIVPVALFEVFRRFALSQGIAWPFTAATIASNIFVALAAAPMLSLWGFDGSALLHLGAVTVQAAAGLLYLAIRRPGEATQALPGLLQGVRDAARTDGLCEFLKLAVPGVLSMTEWWFWEVTCFRAGVFGAHSLAAHTVAYMAVPILFQVPRGIQMGFVARAGALLGEGRGKAAKKVALGGLAVGVLFVLMDAALVWAAQEEYIAQMAGSSNELTVICRKIWPFVIFFLVVDGLFPLNQGICNIHSHQGRVSVSMILSLWVVGVPITISSADLVSLWQIFPLCYILLNALLVMSYACSDWELAAQRASHKAEVPIGADMEKANISKFDSPNSKNLQPQVLGVEDVQNIDS